MDLPKKYTFVNLISEDGNFGNVKLYKNNFQAGRLEAVKVISARSQDEQGKILEIKQNMFESSVLEYLKQSPYIVEIYDAQIMQEGFRINMEYLRSGSLQGLLRVRPFIMIDEILKIGECVTHALEHTHQYGILHLDVKPGNILIKNKNIFKLSDFGLSNLKNNDGSGTFTMIYGTHCPPENISETKTEASDQSDIYMLGVTLYRLINGDAQFHQQLFKFSSRDELNTAITEGKFPSRDSYLPHVHPKIKQIINKCLDLNLDRRYQNVRSIRLDLNKIVPKYVWQPIIYSESSEHWYCYLDSKQILELLVQKNGRKYNIETFKYRKNSKACFAKYTGSNLSRSEYHRIINKLFKEYF